MAISNKQVKTRPHLWFRCKQSVMLSVTTKTPSQTWKIGNHEHEVFDNTASHSQTHALTRRVQKRLECVYMNDVCMYVCMYVQTLPDLRRSYVPNTRRKSTCVQVRNEYWHIFKYRRESSENPKSKGKYTWPQRSRATADVIAQQYSCVTFASLRVFQKCYYFNNLLFLKLHNSETAYLEISYDRKCLSVCLLPHYTGITIPWTNRFSCGLLFWCSSAPQQRSHYDWPQNNNTILRIIYWKY